MRAVVSPEFCAKWQLRIVGNVELFIWRIRFINILNFSKFTLPVEGTHAVEEDAALVCWHVKEIKVWACFPHGLWADTSATVKPCFCVRIFGGGTVQLFRVLSEVLNCPVFSNSRIGNSFRYWWRHVSLFHRESLIVILNWFPCVVRCSVRSSGRLLITHAIMFLVPLLHFHGTWIYSWASRRLRSLLWPHGLIIELQVDGVSRECEGFKIVILTEAIFFW